MADKLQIWTPSEFKGTDMLPIRKDVDPDDVPLIEETDVESKDIQLPTLSVLQGMSDTVKKQLVEGAAPGKLFDEGSQQVITPPVRLLVLFRFRGNALFPNPKNSRHEGLEVCVSRDGVTGSVYGDCAECKKCTEWVLGEDGKSYCIGSETQQFVVWHNGGISLMRWLLSSRFIRKNFRTLNTKKVTSGKNWFAHPMVLTTEMVSDNGNDWFIPKMWWQERDKVPPSTQRECAAWVARINDSIEAGTFSEHDPATQDSAPPGEPAVEGEDSGEIPF